MTEYKDILNKLTISDLKELIRRYMKEVKIKITGLKKEELIEHILKHTEYKDKKIVSKIVNVDYNISSYSRNIKEINKPIEKEINKSKSKTKKTVYTEHELKTIDKMEKLYGVDFTEKVYGKDYIDLKKSKENKKK